MQYVIEYSYCFVNDNGFMSELSSLDQRKNAIDSLIEKALFCLNLENDDQREELKSFLVSFFSMQGPEFFLQLNDEKTQKAYAGAMCDLWHFYQNQRLDYKVNLSFFRHPYNDDQTFLSIVSKDCSYILKTIHHIIKKHSLKVKNIIHPVLHIKRDDQGRYVKSLDLTTLKKEESYSVESVVHFLIVNPLTEVQREHLRLTIEKSFIELYIIEKTASLLNDKISAIKSDISHFHEEEVFLNWLKNGKYYFYGYRFFKKDQAFNTKFTQDESSSIGLFTIESLKFDAHLTPICDERLDQPIVRVYKSSLRSNINRGSRYDCIEIPSLNQKNEIIGFHQIIGVFTPDFFETSSLHAPLARVRAKKIFKQFKFDPNWYNGKLLSMIMDSISLDLFFQLDDAEISDICQRVLEIQNGVVAYIKPHKNDDYVLVLVYMPVEKYSFTVKDEIKSYFEETFKGTIYSEHILIGEYPFARLVFVLDRNKEIPIYYQTCAIQSHLSIITQTWDEKLEKLVDSTTAYKVSQMLSNDYKKDFEPDVAILDFEDALNLKKEDDLVINVHTYESHVRLHVFNKKQFIPLSSILSVLGRFGLQVISEKSYVLNRSLLPNAAPIYLQIFYIELKNSCILFDNEDLKKRFIETLHLVWMQKIKDDHLNELILTTPFDYRDLMLLRLYGKVLCQIGIPYSFDHIAETLCLHKDFTKKIVDLFKIKFSPDRRSIDEFYSVKEDLEAYCKNLKKVDEDRILRRFLNLIDASIRTNFFQTKEDSTFKHYISVKFNSPKIFDLPTPKPCYEIYVYSMNTEGVHLRAGKVARGGIRWSDRLDDFRSEILGLVKAQTVKNSVIVPLGAKGGFISKHYEEAKDKGVDHQTLKSMVVESYRTFIMGLLDITDNIIQGIIQKPKNCVCYDEDDPYLVVAADKGTATFSDIANEISNQYNFWLGDAFASGGSRGYDHKKMAITARGAWISAHRHFLEKRIDIQKESITVVGVGDMAGDVFGNGMLQSDKIKLVAAFNHEHIFLDPTPHPEKSYDERKRLFKTVGSKWSDYNKDLISEGGGVYSRRDKEIKISEPVRQMLGFQDSVVTVSSEELIKNILTSSVDLLFFGGIGTFIKAHNESDQDVKDRANDSLRVNGIDVKAKVIVEGANLGATQKGRIEYALKGGRINMDAVDNSAGVDCSDHEVNIKIFFNYLIQHQLLTMKKRDDLLVQMTDSVADLVLKDNKDQTFLLSQLEMSVLDYTERYKDLMEKLSISTFLPLDVQVEFLPSLQDLSQRHIEKKSFTRPELAILISYAKLHLYQEILNSFDTSSYEFLLNDYFPKVIVDHFKNDLTNHPLKREIISTYIANDIINHLGMSFVYEISNTLGLPHVDVVEHLLKIFDLLNLKDLIHQIKTDQNIQESKKYGLLNDLISYVKKIFFAYYRNIGSFKTLNPLDFKLFIEDFSKTVFPHTVKDIHKEKMDIIRFAPLAMDLYKVLKNKNLEKTQLFDAFKKMSHILDFQFLIHLVETITIHYEWERIAHYLLSDDLFKTMIRVVEKYCLQDHTEKMAMIKDKCFTTYNNHKDLAKIAIQKDQNALALIAYLKRQLQSFLGE
ncbi:MAG: NAD-specific glutamate dehydrogenase [Holosporales bacterium]